MIFFLQRKVLLKVSELTCYWFHSKISVFWVIFALKSTQNYRRISGFAGHGFACKDRDECSYDKNNEGGEICEKDHLCLNTEGSYQCICSEGYKGLPGNCSDIDECLRTGLFLHWKLALLRSVAHLMGVLGRKIIEKKSAKLGTSTVKEIWVNIGKSCPYSL